LISSTIVGFAQASIGERPSLSIVAGDVGLSSSSSTHTVILTLGHGYCPNTDKHNKQAAPGLCELPSLTTKPANKVTLNYAYGRLDDWHATFAAHESFGSSSSRLSPCSSKLFFGAYDMGFRPSVSLFRIHDDSNHNASDISDVDDGRLVMVAVQEGRGRCGLLDYCGGCGQSNVHHGLIIDGFGLRSMYD
jgi:hypothetical protein